jgi:glycerophosphoryl diester phosphodiesterase
VRTTLPRVLRPQLGRATALAATLVATLAATLAAPIAPAAAQAPTTAGDYGTLTGARPLVLGHRGASGYRPEHTLEAYRVAIQQGADFIEPDLVLTKDGVPIARHEPLFGATAVNGVAVPVPNEYTTTNIFDHPEFASRLRTRTLDGTSITGFWADDFTLAEVKTLRARERIPTIRPGNVAFNDLYEIPTLQEVVDLAKEQSLATGRTIGIYPETKHPTFFAQNAANRTNPARFEDVVVGILHANYGNRADAPVFLQSFEVANLQYLRTQTQIPLVQLLNTGSARPYDFVVAGDPRTYADLIAVAGLEFINDYAAGIGPTRDLLIPRPGNVIGRPTNAVANAHAAGLLVHPFTFRAENNFLSAGYRIGSSPSDLGNYLDETLLYLQLGVDGFFTDHPDLGVRAVNAVNVVPEPSTVVLLASGGLVLAGYGARRRRGTQAR